MPNAESNLTIIYSFKFTLIDFFTFAIHTNMYLYINEYVIAKEGVSLRRGGKTEMENISMFPLVTVPSGCTGFLPILLIELILD